MLPQDSMGHDDNIVDRHFIRLAQQKAMTLPQLQQWILQLLEEGDSTDTAVEQLFYRAATAWGQTVEEAKRNTKELLQRRKLH